MGIMDFRRAPVFRFIILAVVFSFAAMLPAQPSYAQETLMMPPPGQMIAVTGHFEPPQMVGLKVDLKNPFSFGFIMDKGQKPMADADRREEFNKIIKYFLVSLAMPNKEMWVNLSPYESGRIVPEIFGQTEMGRDLLAQDYILKQFTASLIYPEGALGKKFWAKVYAQAQARFGTTNINVNTFNKVWIVADRADIYQKGDTALLVGSHLKVMLEQDFMAIDKNKEQFGTDKAMPDKTRDTVAALGANIVREIIIPAIEKEVNEGANFAPVRQVYAAEIMATWYKRTLRESLLGQVFADKSKVAGQKVDDPQAKEKIYKEYLRAYKKGVFNFIKEDQLPGGEMIPRKYFSGGLVPLKESELNVINGDKITDPAQVSKVHEFVVNSFRSTERYVTVLAAFLVILNPVQNQKASDYEIATPNIVHEIQAPAVNGKAAHQWVLEEQKAPSSVQIIHQEQVARFRGPRSKDAFYAWRLIHEDDLQSFMGIANTTVSAGSAGGGPGSPPDDPFLAIFKHLWVDSVARSVGGKSAGQTKIAFAASGVATLSIASTTASSASISVVINPNVQAAFNANSGTFSTTGTGFVPAPLAPTQTRDAAQVNQPDKHDKSNVGGINLSDEHLTMNIRLDGKGVPLPVQFQDRSMMNLNGLTSVIRDIAPISPQNAPELFELLK